MIRLKICVVVYLVWWIFILHIYILLNDCWTKIQEQFIGKHLYYNFSFKKITNRLDKLNVSRYRHIWQVETAKKFCTWHFILVMNTHILDIFHISSKLYIDIFNISSKTYLDIFSLSRMPYSRHFKHVKCHCSWRFYHVENPHILDTWCLGVF